MYESDLTRRVPDYPHITVKEIEAPAHTQRRGAGGPNASRGCDLNPVPRSFYLEPAGVSSPGQGCLRPRTTGSRPCAVSQRLLTTPVTICQPLPTRPVPPEGLSSSCCHRSWCEACPSGCAGIDRWDRLCLCVSWAWWAGDLDQGSGNRGGNPKTLELTDCGQGRWSLGKLPGLGTGDPAWWPCTLSQ